MHAWLNQESNSVLKSFDSIFILQHVVVIQQWNVLAERAFFIGDLLFCPTVRVGIPSDNMRVGILSLRFKIGVLHEIAFKEEDTCSEFMGFVVLLTSPIFRQLA